MRALSALIWMLTAGMAVAQDRLLLTALPRAEANRISAQLLELGLPFSVEVLTEGLEDRLARDPKPAVLHAINGFALIDLLAAGRLRVLPKTLSDQLEPFWADPGHHVLITMADPWVIAFAQASRNLGAVPVDFEAFVDPSLATSLTLPLPHLAPSLWMALIQDQSRQGYSEERAFAWLGSVDARVSAYQDSIESCIRSLVEGSAQLSVLPLRQVLAKDDGKVLLDYRLPQRGIPLRGLGLAALVEVDAEIESLLTFLCEPEMALQLARRQHILPCLRAGLTNADLPRTLQPVLSRAIPYRPLLGDRRAWFTRWEQQVQGRGLAAEQLDDWLDVVFGVIFLGLLAFVYSRTRTIDERS